MAKKIRCPRCNGSGYTQELRPHPDVVRRHFYGEKVWVNETCRKCKGKGWIKEPGWLERLYPEYFD